MLSQIELRYRLNHLFKEGSVIKIPQSFQYYYEHGVWWFISFYGSLWIRLPNTRYFIRLVDPNSIQYVLKNLFDLVRMLSLRQFLASELWHTRHINIDIY